MSKLKVFVSSTCYDLNIVRSQLRSFIEKMGYEPVMSDYNDILYDPRVHTHESCVKEVQNCDVVVLIIGSRFGGEAIPSLLDKIDWVKLGSLSSKTEVLEATQKKSITQLEIFKAIENEIPIYVFIDNSVFHDHLFYEKNKHTADFIKTVKFPSIEKNETATYIFEFINFLRARVTNNGITPFSTIEEIETYLRNQWSFLFQQLLSERSSTKADQKIYASISNQIEDIKAVLVSTISSDDLKETAQGVLKFRRIIQFAKELSQGIYDIWKIKSWDDVLKKCEIEEIATTIDERRNRRINVYIKTDNTFFETRMPFGNDSLSSEWNKFMQISEDKQQAIIGAIDEQALGMRYLIYRNEKWDELNNREALQEPLF